jgi:putative MATE family efflux protein
LFTITGFACGGALRGAGDTRTLLKVTALTNVVNVVANFAFIYGLPRFGLRGMGVVGAAWGTALARGLGTTILLIGLTNGRLVLRLLGPRRWKPDLVVLREILRIGIPTSVSAFALNLFGVLVIGILARTGSGRLAVAAFGLSMTFRNLGTWMTYGLSEATLSMVGQNIGAGQWRRADQAGRASATVAFLFLLALGALMALGSPYLLPLLLNEPDPERKAQVVHIGVIFMATQVAVLPCLGVGMVLGSALRGTGDAVSPLLLNLVSLYVFGLPCAALLALPLLHLGPVTLAGLGWGHWGVWVGMAASSFARGGLTYGWWRRGSWVQAAVERGA